MKRLMMTLLCAFVVKAAVAETIYITATNFGSYRTLQNGNTYLFAENITFAAPATDSAMKVADGANVIIEIAKGVTVNLTGGDANGTVGAGAGIEVPENATLTICGEGELIATGGAAYEGSAGEQGNGAGYTDGGVYLMYAGEGGNGGAGGGGAGAGIGGRGGAGANYKMRNSPAVAYYDGTAQGVAGSEGNAGGAGGKCGTVIVRGKVKVTAKSGTVPANHAAGGGYSTANFDYGNHGSYFYVGYSGGGGGGGGSGCEASGIGGGGGGGGSGGSGGSGGVTWFYYTNRAHEETGDGNGGAGGFGGADGLGGATAIGTWITAAYDGNSYQRDSVYHTLSCASGGAGGAAGAKGDDGSQGVSTSASVNGAGGALQDPAIDGVSVWACEGDGWTFDPTSGKVTLTKNRLCALTGDVTFANARAVKLIGLKPGVTLNASGLPGITSLTTDDAGTVTGLCLINGNYNFTLGDGVFSFTVGGGSETEFEAVYSVSFTFGAHIGSVGYTTEPYVTSGTANDNFTLTGIKKGTKIKFTKVVCEDGYEYRGAKELTVGAENMQVAFEGAVCVWFPKVEYCDAQGKQLEAKHVFKFSNRTSNTIGGGEWYLIEGVEKTETITVQGEANLILADDAKLVVMGGKDRAGIEVAEGNSLAIWVQTGATGELVAFSGSDGAGIGGGGSGAGGKVTINGGKVTAICCSKVESASEGLDDGGPSDIAPGMDDAASYIVDLGVGGRFRFIMGFNGAGIGGGRSGAGGMVTINGGTVTINGGEVTATSDIMGAGIGGGDGGAGGEVEINGGIVNAYGGGYHKDGFFTPEMDNIAGAGIGSGGGSECGGMVTINGGTVTATGGLGGGESGANGAGIGSGCTETSATVMVTINGGNVKASSIQGQPKNVNGANVYCVTVPCTTSPCAITGLDDYGTKDIVSVDGKAYLYLQNGEYVFSVGGVKYRAVVNSAATTAGLYPTSEGGEIAEGEGGEWIVTPNAGVTEVTVANLPAGAIAVVPPSVTKVNGVADTQIKVRFGAYDITGAFTVSGGAIALNENGAVTIGGEAIPVKPIIGDLDDGEPFAVGEGSAAVTVRTIPGLKYALIRGIELGAITTMVVEPTLATEAQMTLEDTDPPAGAAFYKVGVER